MKRVQEGRTWKDGGNEKYILSDCSDDWAKASQKRNDLYIFAYKINHRYKS
jgi:hypothetical protein